MRDRPYWRSLWITASRGLLHFFSNEPIDKVTDVEDMGT